MDPFRRVFNDAGLAKQHPSAKHGSWMFVADVLIPVPIPENVIPRRWITAGHDVLWGGSKGTYAPVEYQRLPELPASDSPFDWLSALPKRKYNCSLDTEENQIAGFAGIQAQVRSLGFHLPPDFDVLITRPDIRAQIPSCTGCYMALPDTVTPLPGFPGSYVVRFMNDSQCCVLWYLLFQPDTPAKVLASGYFIERDMFDMMEYQAEPNRPLRYEDVLKESCICAESFGEFVYRFCIENVIWFAMRDKVDLSPHELDYLQKTQKGV